jgi:D-galactarolactone cycloisomerase
MRIERIETFTLKAPLGKERFFSSQDPFHERTSLLVRAMTGHWQTVWSPVRSRP